ncbi:hypothetical protein [Streptococcus agalactiae]|uniref:hypothetical protein n=1 Tax=Streptococcus agalactiae TaxID=1311 RepID=UPI000A2FF8AB|nr:hypothetical protein [Streptococcus agalactiae]MCD0012082.1 hypothetical protein [Streptococcus agalactiae]MCQ3827756.1 hypothetical protein [Streptococcus agalactiae]SIW58244.1 hypothetical protein BQ8897_BM110_01788 [Streptococcus agalactiae]HEN4322756.1 hypothetical protein [Streptococcus agalactiae]
MSSFKFKLDRKGVSDLMKSQPMQDVLKKHATSIKDRCGKGYEQDIFIGKNRANAKVAAVSHKAKKDVYANNTLLKAVR